MGLNSDADVVQFDCGGWFNDWTTSVPESEVCAKTLNESRMKFVISEELTKRFAWLPVTLNDGGLGDGEVVWMETYYMCWCRQRGRVNRMSKREGEHRIDIRRRVDKSRREYEASLLD